MNISVLCSLAILFASEVPLHAQYTRRDVNGLEPGESRHHMENALRYQRQQAEQQREWDLRTQRMEWDTQWRAQQYPQPLPTTEIPSQNAVAAPEEERPDTVDTVSQTTWINAGICLAALVALILIHLGTLVRRRAD